LQKEGNIPLFLFRKDTEDFYVALLIFPSKGYGFLHNFVRKQVRNSLGSNLWQQNSYLPLEHLTKLTV